MPPQKRKKKKEKLQHTQGNIDYFYSLYNEVADSNLAHAISKLEKNLNCFAKPDISQSEIDKATLKATTHLYRAKEFLTVRVYNDTEKHFLECCENLIQAYNAYQKPQPSISLEMEKNKKAKTWISSGLALEYEYCMARAVIEKIPEKQETLSADEIKQLKAIGQTMQSLHGLRLACTKSTSTFLAMVAYLESPSPYIHNSFIDQTKEFVKYMQAIEQNTENKWIKIQVDCTLKPGTRW